MIAVLGRPALAAPLSDRGVAQGTGLGGVAAAICVEASAAGARVELVGSVGDDAEGDEVIIRLARAGVGHAAVLRDPAGRTPVAGGDSHGRPGPRLDAGDISLGLRYLLGYDVLVIAEPLGAEALAVALEAARYHAASVIAIVQQGTDPGPLIAGDVTVLEAPAGDVRAFTQMVGRYATDLTAGGSPAEAFAAAARESGSDPSPEPPG